MIKTTIYGHPEFAAFIQTMNALYAERQQCSAVTLNSLSILQNSSRSNAAGTVEDLLGRMGAVLDRGDRPPYERTLASARTLLAHEAFERS